MIEMYIKKLSAKYVPAIERYFFTDVRVQNTYENHSIKKNINQ